jgi:8-oxo-dGTP pyrophosphatase MutT (NUDIX family)
MNMKQKIIIASGPVIVEDNKVLLNQHGDTAFWKFCGGTVEDFSTGLAENAKREVKEEMGIDIKITSDTPFFWYTKKEKEDVEIDVILVHYLAERIGEINPGDDIREWTWLPLEDLDKENLAPNIIPVLKHFGFLGK